MHPIPNLLTGESAFHTSRQQRIVLGVLVPDGGYYRCGESLFFQLLARRRPPHPTTAPRRCVGRNRR